MLFSVVLVLSACGSKKKEEKVSTEQVQFKPYQEEEGECRSLDERPEDFESEKFNYTQVTGFRQEGRCALIEFQYSGCQVGTPVLVMGEQNVQGKRALPLQLEIKVKGAGFCEMLIQDSTWYNLAALKLPSQVYEIKFNRQPDTFYFRRSAY